ncbi:hypothetical protein [Paracoccus cavernae]
MIRWGAWAGDPDTGGEQRKNGQWKFSALHGLAAAIGMPHNDMAQLSLWEFTARVDGYGRANGWKTRGAGGDLSESELAEMGIEGF